MSTVIPIVVVGTGMVVASITDVQKFKVYNNLTFPIFFAGLLFGIVQAGWGGFGTALAGAAIGFGILFIPYLMGGVGAGDVKFVMAMGSWIGPGLLLPAIIVGCIAIAGYYFLLIARQQGMPAMWHNLQLMFLRLSCFGRNLALNDQFESVQSAALDTNSQNRGRLIPFSAMMSIGIVVVFAITWCVGKFGN